MFYNNFQALCKERGTTPTAVGRALGIKQQTVSLWKTRGSIPNSKTLERIADYFGISVGMLIDYNDYATANFVTALSQAGLEIDLSTAECDTAGATSYLVWPRVHPEEKVRAKTSELHYALRAAGIDAGVARSERLYKELNLPPPEYVSTNIGGIEINPALVAGMNIFQP